MADVKTEAEKIGETIKHARQRAGRSQTNVATALGYHQSKLSRLESGRGTEDTRVLRAVAAELGIPLHILGLSDPAPSAAGPPDDPETEDMRRRTFLAASIASLTAPTTPATATHDDLVRALLPGPRPISGQGGASDTSSLETRVAAARRLFCTCDYAELETTLPSLLADLREAAGDHRNEAEMAGLLATAYQTSTSLLLKQGDHGNAWLAVGRALAEAERSGDPVVLASSVRVHAHVLTREKHTTQAVTLVRHTAGQLAGSYERRSPRYLAAVGLLLLRGVTAASTAGDRAATREFLDEAQDVARYVALDRPDAWANFSPTNLALHAVSAAVAFGDAGIALNTAAPLMRRHIPVPERRAALWVEAARAYNQQGRLAEGYQALRIAETCAAQDVRRPAVRDLVADMAARDRRRTLPELHHFSRRLGVPA
ncbi:helix-turn-helix domain-containing protein [Streptomyces marianii]|uniref:Helix-turn-helix transcriptional regulator n=1 Tax=Streptomyces marianii TaxID=1817406 RepID=A0A5R9E8Y4_9ACTN|nr:helix-turn-helix transcriptional regulator [Streptomyces marianii]TLQ44684.1 helix-turn-helix transcriptional regulator [Streptomyces marianii]